MEEGFICFGFLALLCLLAALPLSVVALILAVRAARRAEDLRRRFESGERRPAPSAEAPASAPRAEAEPALPPPLRPEREPAAAAPAPPRPPIPPAAPAPAPSPRGRVRWEEWIGLKGLALAGIVVFLIGAALFAAYAHEQGWFGRRGYFQCSLLALGGILFLVAADVLARRAWRVISRVVTGGGLAMEYFAVYAAWARFGIVPEPAAWILMVVITGAAIALAVRYASLTVAILSLVGGLVGPILISPERDPGHVLFLYLVAVNAGVLVLAYFKKWRVLNLLALVGTIANVAAWLFAHYWHGGVATEKLPFILTYMTVLWGMYFALSIVYHLLGTHAPSRLDLPVTLVNVVAYFGGLYALLEADHHWVLGPAAAALAAVYLVEGLAVRAWSARHMRFVILQLAQAIGLATLAIPIQLEGIFIPMAWGVEAAVLFYLGIRLADWRVRAVGLLIHLASVVALGYFAEEAEEAAGPLVLNARTATYAVVALAMAVSAWLYRRVATRPSAERVAVTAAVGLAHAVLIVLVLFEAGVWENEVSADVIRQHPPDLSARLAHLRWIRDAASAAVLGAYGLLAVGLVAGMKRAFHHAMALAAFGVSMFCLARGLGDAPPLDGLAGWNAVGATFAAVAGCLAASAIVSRYATAAALGRRGKAVTYELLAVAVVLGLYLTELFRVRGYMETALGASLSGTSLLALVAAGLAVMGGGLMLRGLWLQSAAHHAAGLLALAVALGFLVQVALPGRHVYGTLLWQPRGVAFLLTVVALALSAVGYGRALPPRSWQRRILGPVLAVVVHPVALALFTLEAMDFWDAHAAAWFPGEELDAWYARHATLSVGYALYALGLLAAGIARRSPLARVVALVVLGVTLGKVLLLDLSRLEAIWRILSFVGLGLLLLAASLLYHRYRHLLFPQETPGGAKETRDATD